MTALRSSVPVLFAAGVVGACAAAATPRGPAPVASSRPVAVHEAADAREDTVDVDERCLPKRMRLSSRVTRDAIVFVRPLCVVGANGDRRCRREPDAVARTSVAPRDAKEGLAILALDWSEGRLTARFERFDESMWFEKEKASPIVTDCTEPALAGDQRRVRARCATKEIGGVHADEAFDITGKGMCVQHTRTTSTGPAPQLHTVTLDHFFLESGVEIGTFKTYDGPLDPPERGAGRSWTVCIVDETPPTTIEYAAVCGAPTCAAEVYRFDGTKLVRVATKQGERRP